MRFLMLATVGIALSLSACSTQSAVLEESAQLPAKPSLTLNDVLPALQPATAEQAAHLQEDTVKFRSRALASEYYVLQANRTFQEQQLDSATYFLNRAYMADSTNNDVYRGYGMVYGQQQQYDKALVVLYHALDNDSDNPLLLNDIATTHMSQFYSTSNPEDLLQSKRLLEQAVALSPDEADVYYKLAINSYYLKDYGMAWDYLHQSLRRDTKAADKAFISALLEKQQDPQGQFTPQLGQ